MSSFEKTFEEKYNPIRPTSFIVRLKKNVNGELDELKEMTSFLDEHYTNPAITQRLFHYVKQDFFIYECPVCSSPLMYREKTNADYLKTCGKDECRKKQNHISTQKGIKKPQFSSANSGRWNGGEYVSSDGYIMSKIEGLFLQSGRQVYKRKHVLIYESFLGREILTEKGGGGEQIHHIDGDKKNNDIENLILCSNAKDHRLMHGSLEKIAFDLVKSGIIKFNKNLKKYYINES
jgi:hypothetical protein